MSSQPIVTISSLSRRFGRNEALRDISLELERGRVYGLVGANGAGKTTLIKHLLGLLRAQTGRVRVFDLDPVRAPELVLGRVGYLSEDRDLPEWMRIEELLRYTAAFYPSWDHEYALQLLATFGLDPRKKVKQLSKGMRAQSGLIVAVAHRPELLILDEPSTGLDAVVRKDILNEIVRTVADEGRTVLFSSHLLDEVEQMSDEVLLIDQGQLALAGELDYVKEHHWVLTLRTLPETSLPSWDGQLSCQQFGGDWQVLSLADDVTLNPPWQIALSSIEAEVVQVRNATLQEIFVARVGRSRLVSPEVA